MFRQPTVISQDSDDQQFELINMNQTFQDIKYSKKDMDIKWYNEFSTAVGRK